MSAVHTWSTFSQHDLSSTTSNPPLSPNISPPGVRNPIFAGVPRMSRRGGGGACLQFVELHPFSPFSIAGHCLAYRNYFPCSVTVQSLSFSRTKYVGLFICLLNKIVPIL
ncbi:hypothetical protein CEXT_282971 [Caerostris extrusa]|uniref:Uncharacterized protein n=1 Tax=Caerostris extrusa TaxID=172846 RepID=A0AAV4W1N7_CAEEX|nr:hypothetical protein CEXT_282971 [Caerostris extrusa]